MKTDDIRIVTGYLPGLIGRVSELHARYYTREWCFTAYFEARVAAEMSEFVNRYDAARDCVWSALQGGRIEGSITIDGIGAADRGAHLRWFIVSDRLRGRGAGARLMDLAMAFCRQQDYRLVYLHSFAGLDAARRLYERAGFELAESRFGEQWGTRVEEQEYRALL